MNVPPPIPGTSVLTSLPRALPPPLAASSLAATLRHARRRRIRRRAGWTVGTAGAAALAWVLALWGTNDFPAGTAAGGRAVAAGGSKQGQGPAETAVAYAPAAVTAPAASATSGPPAVLAVSGDPHSISDPPAVPMPLSPAAPQTPPPSFVLVRSQPGQTVRTTPAGSTPPAAAAPADSNARSPGSFTLVATASVPAPMVITTRRTIAPQSIATADQASTPEPATDADLFAHADGRPAALCRLNSGGTRWFWLDQLTLR